MRDEEYLSAQPEPLSPYTYQVEKYDFGGRKRTLAITLWSMAALLSLTTNQIFLSVAAILKEGRKDTETWSVLTPEIMDFIAAEHVALEIAIFSLVAFVVALIFALRALVVPGIRSIHKLHYERPERPFQP